MLINYNPTNAAEFSSIPTNVLLKECGYVPLWAMDWAKYGGKDIDQEMMLFPYLQKRYGFPTPLCSGVIEDNGLYKYPGDPDMAPSISIEFFSREDDGDSEEDIPIATIYQYNSGFVAVVQGDNKQIVRMD